MTRGYRRRVGLGSHSDKDLDVFATRSDPGPRTRSGSARPVLTVRKIFAVFFPIDAVWLRLMSYW